MNYEGGGFTIVSGDDRQYPILAYSETDSFPVDENQTLPSAVVGWLRNMDEQVLELRRENKDQKDDIKRAWTSLEKQSRNAENPTTQSYPEEFDPCTRPYEDNSVVTTYSPYLQTKWGQGVGFNDALTYMGCSSYSNGKPPTGCVATATAQIMKYHQYPASFNWSSMPNYGGPHRQLN